MAADHISRVDRTDPETYTADNTKLETFSQWIVVEQVIQVLKKNFYNRSYWTGDYQHANLCVRSVRDADERYTGCSQTGSVLNSRVLLKHKKEHNTRAVTYLLESCKVH